MKLRGESNRGEETGSLSKDDVFDVFSNQRRRLVFDHLRRRDDPVDMSELSTRITAVELGAKPEQVGYDDRKSVHTSLYQFHLPKMDEAGIVEFDRGSGDITLTEQGADLDVYLETVSEDEIPWALYFLLLSTTMLLAVAAVWMGLYPFTLFGYREWAGIVSVASFVSSLAYLYSSRYEMRLGAGDVPTYED
jgi:DNA-binding transcriptional ArsR family regulator